MMKKLNEAFFAKEGEKGLTLTSAAHLCAMASQVKQHYEKVLQNVRFIDTTVSVVGNGTENITELGMKDSDLYTIPEAIEQISGMNAVISWFAEARKEVEAYKKSRLNCGICAWCEEILGEKYPEEPTADYSEVGCSTMENVIDDMPIKDRERYLSLEAKASVYGKFIHPGNPMDSAREGMHQILTTPCTTMGSGRDLLIYNNKPSATPKNVDDLFERLQNDYRKVEQELNHMKADILKELERRRLEEDNKRREISEAYSVTLTEYKSERQRLNIAYSAWLTKEQGEIAKLRIAIPNSLLKAVDYLNSLGK